MCRSSCWLNRFLAIVMVPTAGHAQQKCLRLYVKADLLDSLARHMNRSRRKHCKAFQLLAPGLHLDGHHLSKCCSAVRLILKGSDPGAESIPHLEWALNCALKIRLTC